MKLLCQLFLLHPNLSFRILIFVWKEQFDMQKGLKAAVTSVHVKLPPDLKQLFSECRMRLDFNFKLPSMPTPCSPKNLSRGSVFACFTLRPSLQSFPPRSVPTPPPPPPYIPCLHLLPQPFPQDPYLPLLYHALFLVQQTLVCFWFCLTMRSITCALSVNPVNPNLIRTQPPLISTHSLVCP